MKITEYSDRYYRKQVADGGPRTAGQIGLIVIHDTEGSTAEGGARTLTTREDASAHLCVDDRATFRLVPELVIAWGTKGYNTPCLHIEQAGFARWSSREWLRHFATIRRSAYWAAVWTARYKIPARFRTTADLNAGRIRGITTHQNVSLSKLSDSTHTDPGPNYPLVGQRSFFALLRFYRAGLKLRILPRPREVRS